MQKNLKESSKESKKNLMNKFTSLYFLIAGDFYYEMKVIYLVKVEDEYPRD